MRSPIWTKTSLPPLSGWKKPGLSAAFNHSSRKCRGCAIDDALVTLRARFVFTYNRALSSKLTFRMIAKGGYHAEEDHHHDRRCAVRSQHVRCECADARQPLRFWSGDKGLQGRKRLQGPERLQV